MFIIYNKFMIIYKLFYQYWTYL